MSELSLLTLATGTGTFIKDVRNTCLEATELNRKWRGGFELGLRNDLIGIIIFTFMLWLHYNTGLIVLPLKI